LSGALASAPAPAMRRWPAPGVRSNGRPGLLNSLSNVPTIITRCGWVLNPPKIPPEPSAPAAGNPEATDQLRSEAYETASAAWSRDHQAPRGRA
jgi:hypothetical protein